MRCGVEDPAHLQKLLELFFGYEREEIADFRKAVEQFKADLPAVLSALRDMIEAAEKGNGKFRKAALRFLKHAQDLMYPLIFKRYRRPRRTWRFGVGGLGIAR
jgi:hypothetical protein